MGCFFAVQVEDDEHDIYFLNVAFEKAGLSQFLRVVRSGEQALDYFIGTGRFSDRQQYPIPGLVFLDLKLPRMNGLQVLKWLRDQPRFHSVIVIVLSASAHPDDVEKASFLGANAYVQKPAGIDDLVRFVQAVKAFWSDFHVFPPEFSELVRHDTVTELKPELRHLRDC